MGRWGISWPVPWLVFALVDSQKWSKHLSGGPGQGYGANPAAAFGGNGGGYGGGNSSGFGGDQWSCAIFGFFLLHLKGSFSVGSDQ